MKRTPQGKPLPHELNYYPELSYPKPLFRVRQVNTDKMVVFELPWQRYLEDTKYLLENHCGITSEKICSLYPRQAFDLIIKSLKEIAGDDKIYALHELYKGDLQKYLECYVYDVGLSMVYYYQRNVSRYFDSILYSLGNRRLTILVAKDIMTPLGEAYYRLDDIYVLMVNQMILLEESDNIFLPVSRHYTDFKKLYGDILSMKYISPKYYLHEKPLHIVLRESIRTIQELDELYGGKRKIFGPNYFLDDKMSQSELEQVLYTYFQSDSFHYASDRITVKGIVCYQVKEVFEWNLQVKPLDFEGIYW